jgi:hypothetical protein
VLYAVIVDIYWNNNTSMRFTDALLWPIIPGISALAAWFGWWQLPGAAVQRGEQVKAVFDLYRGILAEALGLKLPSTQEAERTMWELVSRRMAYRLSEDAKSLDEFRNDDDKTYGDEKADARKPLREESEGGNGHNDRSEQGDKESEDETTC